MNLFHKLSNRYQTRNVEQTILTSVFTWAGLALLAVFGVGLISWAIIDSTGALSVIKGRRFDWEIYRQLNGEAQTAISRIGVLSIVGMVLIFASWILRMIWIFRFEKVSKMFIYITFALFIVGQGTGFGILFATWNAPDLLAIFGITGGLFVSMAIIGWFARNLSGMLPFLIVGFITLSVLSLLNLILYFSGVYSDKLTFLIIILSGFLALAYIAFDVWLIKRTSEIYQNYFLNQDFRFKLVSFLAFQLLTDFIWLLWTVVRLYSRIKN